MMLVFLNFDLNIGDSKIGLIPNFLGYWFILQGLEEVDELSNQFHKVKPLAKVMIVYSGINYAIDLFGIFPSIDLFDTVIADALLVVIFGVLSTILSLLISYSIIMGIKDVQDSKKQELNADNLYSTWKLMAVFSVLTFVLLSIPTIAIVSIIISFVIAVYYLYTFNKTKVLFCMYNQ